MEPKSKNIGLCRPTNKDRNCANYAAGYHMVQILLDKPAFTWVLCYDNISTPAQAVEVATHELVHAYDACSGCQYSDVVHGQGHADRRVVDCFELACTEIRAVAISGTCLPGGTAMKLLKLQDKGCTYDKCVRNQAGLAVAYDAQCRENADEYVDAMYQYCSIKEGTGVSEVIRWPLPLE